MTKDKHSGWMVCNLILWWWGGVGVGKGGRMSMEGMLSGLMETTRLALIICTPCLAIYCSCMFVSACCNGCVATVSAVMQATSFLWVCWEFWRCGQGE